MELEKRTEVDEQKWVYDSSIDHKANIPLRSSTGVWKAAKFIIAIEFSERLTNYGIATSLIIYITKVIQQDLKIAARNVNYWSGVTTLMPLIGGFVADAHLGRFYTVFVSTIVYLLGLILLTLTWFLPSLKPCNEAVCHEPRKVHEVVFYIAIYLISIATGGHKPALESFGADQFDDDHSEERRKKMSYFNWWGCGLCSGVLLGVTLIVYVQDHVSWGVADIVLTAVMTMSLVILILGRPFYRYRVPTGSPLAPLLQVLVAAIRKRNLQCPSNSAELYEVPKSQMKRGRLLCHTNKLVFLDKAAIIESTEENSAEKKNPWRLQTVTKVEELKLILNMIPIWMATLPFGICVAQTTTFFIKQGTTLDRHIGNGFQIPSAWIYSLSPIGMIISLAFYEKILVPVLRKMTGNERGVNILQRIGIGMVFSLTSMVVAAMVERKRLDLVERNPLKGSLTMSVFWLVPQFLIIGLGDGFTLIGLQEYFYDQVPDPMRSLGIAFYLSVVGAASFISSLLITLVDHLTGKDGRSWFGKDLNSSRLDKFYWLLAGITTANMLLYVLLAKRYSYKKVQRNMAAADCNQDDPVASMAGGV